MNRWTALIIILGSLLPLARASAHDIGAMRVDLQFPAGGVYRLDVVVDLDHVPSSVRGGFVAHLAARSWVFLDGSPVRPGRLELDEPVLANGEPTSRRHAVFTGDVPAGVASLGWATELDMPEYYFVTGSPDAETRPFQWLSGGERSADYPIAAEASPRADAQAGPIFPRYVSLGFTHIVPEGLDHILFVLALFLASTSIRPLLSQITAFTIAHSITLALSMYGVVRIPSSIVEPLIAISIVAVAAENLLIPEVRPHRVGLVFLFGLLHGLGFASVLTDVGLPRGQFVSALVGFNVGVELGQLAVLTAAFAAVGVWASRREWYRARVVTPASVAIGMVALYWTAQRVLAG